jgi:DAK2 domain fusion protein YloV
LSSRSSSDLSQPFPPDPRKPVLACDGQGFKRLLNAGFQWMGQHTELINSLNVFPVPDGDTGTNMYLTMQAAYKEIEDLPSQQVGAIAQSASRVALMGARGNSGVILSQILRGLSQGLEGKEDFNSVEFANALKLGSKVAYQAVIKPVEGTILTVIRESSDAALAVAVQLNDLRELFEYVAHTAQESVARTPALLPILREAGVVDAGGQGLFVILEGMARYLQGQSLVSARAMSEVVDLHSMEDEAGYGYDVQYILQGEALDIEQIRADITKMGEYALVVGDSRTAKVHVHTFSPGDPLNYAVKLGGISSVIVENMQEQYQEFILGQASPLLPAKEQEELAIAVIVVSPGPGLDKLFESLGGTAVVSGGQTMNPSTEQLLQAIQDVPAPEVIVLPNNSNVILAAQQAQALSDKRVRVVATKTVPQGVSALLAFNYGADLETNVRLMERNAQLVRTAEITIAVRDVRINGLEVKEGQVIGLIDGELQVAADDLQEVVAQVLERLDLEQAEIVTFYYGKDMTEESTRTLADWTEAQYPDLEVEVIEGGQPHYQLIISAE